MQIICEYDFNVAASCPADLQFLPDNLPGIELMMSCVCCRKWKSYTTQSKRDTEELALKMDMTKKHFERKCKQAALTKWSSWVKLYKKIQAGR